METQNLFERVSDDQLANEYFEVLLESGACTLERIVSQGHATPAGEWYDQAYPEWVVLLQGSAGLAIEGEADIHLLRPGDYLYIPAHCRHRVEWTQADMQTVWLALHHKVV
jgi:cupin 2 domain-containing protein